MQNMTITPGGDPRGYTETDHIRDEMAKLSHPARPDVNWQRVEQCCQTLFSKNGIDLRTAVFYTAARGQLAGLTGINEGLEIVSTLVSRYWAQLWPQQTHTRVELLSWLSGSMLQRLRALSLSYGDLQQIYRAEKQVAQLCSTLQLLELKQLSRLEQIQLWLQQAAAALEHVDESSSAMPQLEDPVVTDEQAPLPAHPQPPPAEKPSNPQKRKDVASKPTVKAAAPARPPVAQQTQTVAAMPATQKQPSATADKQEVRRRPGFFAGFLCALVLAMLTILVAWWLMRSPAAPVQAMFDKVAPTVAINGATDTAPLNAALTPGMLESIREPWLKALDEKLVLMAALPPLWKERQASQLILEAQTLWPDEAGVMQLSAREQQRREALALPDVSLGDWHLAQQRLEGLTQRLNALDERRGRWLTGSELKTAIFDIRQALDKTPPVEELLRQLQQQQAEGANTAALRKQIDFRLEQLLNRYALLDEQERASGNTLSR